MNLRQALNKAIQNETCGASQFIEEVTNDLILALEDLNFIKDVNQIRRFALELFHARSSMAPVFHLCNLLLQSIENDILNVDLLKNKIAEFRKMEREQRIQAASICAAKLNGSKFITISRSGSVIDALKELKLKRDIEVVVMESQPGGEGLKTAKDLIRLGIKVILINDTMVFNEAQKCDAGLVGVDSLIPNGVVNKIGTRSLALACRESGICCNIVAAENRILPFNCMDPLRSSSKIEEVQFEKQVFEVTPFSLFNTWFSNKGFYTSDKITDSIKNLRIAEILNRKLSENSSEK